MLKAEKDGLYELGKQRGPSFYEVERKGLHVPMGRGEGKRGALKEARGHRNDGEALGSCHGGRQKLGLS